MVISYFWVGRPVRLRCNALVKVSGQAGYFKYLKLVHSSAHQADPSTIVWCIVSWSYCQAVWGVLYISLDPGQSQYGSKMSSRLHYFTNMMNMEK